MDMQNREVPVVAFIGYSGSGKTTFIEKLIPLLIERGLRVAVLKHDSHGFEIDREGKDTWRFSKAGAGSVAIASGEKAVLFINRPQTLDDMIKRVKGEADLIIVEGYKTEKLPKIEIHRAASNKPMYADFSELRAIVTDVPIDAPIPVFGLEDHSEAAEFIAESFIKRDMRGR